MAPPPPRRARLVLRTPDHDAPLVLPPLPVPVPWWQEVEAVVAAARETYGIGVTVLRMLEVGTPDAAGLTVTYLAQADRAPPDAAPWDGVLDDHPLRLPYARPDGPAADLAWAEGVLRGHGLAPVSAPTQVRTWNLSSLWRIPVAGQTVWLKAVPPFFAHEGAVLEALAGEAVPRLFGQESGRVLMPELPGEDLYFARGDTLRRMIDLLVPLQARWIGREAELFALGLPDWRGPALAGRIAQVLARDGGALPLADRAKLDQFVEGLPARFAQIAACGLPDTLVHGDFHPGNLRGDETRLTLLDWGDCGVGHPLLDQPAFLERAQGDEIAALRAYWRAAWRAALPGCDPARAEALLAPVAAARQAMIYRGFLDNIEPSEHPYHAADPADWLGRTAALL